MTDTDKLKITDLRAKGAGYGEIAKRLNISINSVKSFCRRSKAEHSGADGEGAQMEEKCLQCGSKLLTKPIRKNRKFCSEPCRRAWWRDNSQLSNRAAFYTARCSFCGKTFESYGNKNRKYCAHGCYIKARYKTRED